MIPEYGRSFLNFNRTVASRERIGRLLKTNTEHDCEVSPPKFWSHKFESPVPSHSSSNHGDATGGRRNHRTRILLSDTEALRTACGGLPGIVVVVNVVVVLWSSGSPIKRNDVSCSRPFNGCATGLATCIRTQLETLVGIKTGKTCDRIE